MCVLIISVACHHHDFICLFIIPPPIEKAAVTVAFVRTSVVGRRVHSE